MKSRSMPCDYSKYPKDWKAIRAEVLERAGHKCEECSVPNYSIGLRSADGTWYDQNEIDGMNSDCGLALFGHLDNPHKETKIVLTISHTDHNINNNGEQGNRPNLRALCQRCHNRHDQPYRQSNAAQTRKRKSGLQDLFP